MSSANANIARHLALMAAAQPAALALKIPRGRTRDGLSGETGAGLRPQRGEIAQHTEVRAELADHAPGLVREGGPGIVAAAIAGPGPRQAVLGGGLELAGQLGKRVKVRRALLRLLEETRERLEREGVGADIRSTGTTQP